MLQKVRAGEDVVAIVKSFRDVDLLLRLKQQSPDRPRYEFPYRTEWPSFLRNEAASGSYLDSMLNRAVVAQVAAWQSPSADPEAAQSEMNQMYLFPYHSAKLVDPRLDSADVAQWTQVLSDNTMLRRLLSIYFIHEYPFHPFFHKDLFLDALSAGNQRPQRSQRFCSSLLVNAVLAAAWVGLAQEYRMFGPVLASLTQPAWHDGLQGAIRLLAPQQHGLPLPRRSKAPSGSRAGGIPPDHYRSGDRYSKPDLQHEWH